MSKTFPSLSKDIVVSMVDARVKARKAATGAGAQGADPNGSCDCCDGSCESLLKRAPRLALARALRIGMVPAPFTISTTFSAAGAQNVPDIASDSDEDDVDRIVYAIDVDIQDPSAFVGNIFKAQRDKDFAISSGLQVSLECSGRKNDWDTSYIPVRALKHLVSPREPWVLLCNQDISADFLSTTPLPFAGTQITITFIAETPGCCDFSEDFCFCQLEQLGYDVGSARKLWGV